VDIFQNVFHTSFLRNANLLKTCAQRLSKSQSREEFNILSFGCSVGDEIASIRLFFPKSRISGCDINTNLLAICKSSFDDDNLLLFESNSKNISDNGPYDLIVASAVLCRNPSPKDYSSVFPFSRFDDILGTFTECLADGGILAIPNAGYLFQESSVYSQYVPIRSDIMFSTTFVDVFRKDGSIFLKQEQSYGEFVYSRHGAWNFLDDESAFDCVFQKSATRAAPVFMRMRPAPDGLNITSTMIRKNVDYCPMKVGDNFVTVEKRINTLSDTSDRVRGYSISVGWRSFLFDGMFRREHPVWFGVA